MHGAIAASAVEYSPNERSLLAVTYEHETCAWNLPQQLHKCLGEKPHAVPRIEQADERDDEGVLLERERRGSDVRKTLDLHAVGNYPYPLGRSTGRKEVSCSVLTHGND